MVIFCYTYVWPLRSFIIDIEWLSIERAAFSDIWNSLIVSHGIVLWSFWYIAVNYFNNKSMDLRYNRLITISQWILQICPTKQSFTSVVSDGSKWGLQYRVCDQDSKRGFGSFWSSLPRLSLYLIVYIQQYFVMEHHWEKKRSGHVETRTFIAGLTQQTSYALDHHASPKKGCIKPRVKPHCLSFFPIRPMLILTSWLTLFLLCNQYYCTEVYILIIVLHQDVIILYFKYCHFLLFSYIVIIL